MKLHKEGYPSIIIVSIILIGGSLAIFFTKPHPIIAIPLQLGLIFLFGLILNFFRSPNRDISPIEDTVVSPADGTVVIIKEVEEKEFLKTKCNQISIFMSVWNVHANRIPISGEVTASKYRPGKYLFAINPKSSEENEAHTTAIKTNKGHVIAVRQIAGVVARRVVCYSKVGKQVTQGKHLGFIKFGSRVDLFLPKEYELKVKLGDKVKGNKNIIAQLNN